ncbi:HlyD family efflux transporter periplasmic adaptor subunit [Marinobacter salinisoli]|uniref:HlyD family efflux transporter periplasmic adaptor subunit n=1 Tax=Marinobacter salinisoli TaxID=2769486 RepID=A0ABX7MMV5_9GAMM|nr:HlyD family efflux transporter periplasmic adaptor subunit [Marinobacter salinisoli]QSP93562.1 HlyD family efflux transporter periplasmic adaptor subunit [Marinobacter salinisoli]
MTDQRSVGKWIFWTLFAGLVIGAVYWAARPEPVWVDLAPVVTGSFEVSITEEGKTRVKDRYLVSSPVAGYLHRVSLEIGDPVEPGQLLTEVEPMPAGILDARSRAEAQARVGAARSALNSARQKVAAAEAEAQFTADELVRLQSLSSKHFISEDRLQQALAAKNRAQAFLNSARFDEEVMAHELAAARTRLEVSAAQSNGGEAFDRVGVRSPVKGAVLGIVRTSEGVIQAGEPILEVGDPTALEVVVDVLSFDAVNLSEGVQVRLDGWGGSSLQAVVQRVEPVGFEDVSALGVKEQRVQVVADIVSPAEHWDTLGDGYRVDATFVLWSADKVLQVPASSVFYADEGTYVFRADDATARLVPVTVGKSNGLHTVIEEGLGEGNLVIRHPDRQLEHGDRVRYRSR